MVHGLKMSKLKPTFGFVKRLEFLSSGKLYLKDSVKTITLSYETKGSRGNYGIRSFISQRLPTIQFKNPNVQVVLFKNEEKFPNIWIYFNDSQKIMLDVEGKTDEEIYSELSAVAGKTEGQVQRALKKAEYNPANFGDSRKGRLCICEVPGQIPCPRRVPLRDVKHSWHDKKQESAV
ncbi:small ribosomal subunit protein mS25-like [Halichondria panicea]|uniref:small ribosomal subunit protein mS25-like n=1 Tax=Halichondria panicea TaxID=6063 RepID=UPI00312B7809